MKTIQSNGQNSRQRKRSPSRRPPPLPAPPMVAGRCVAVVGNIYATGARHPVFTSDNNLHVHVSKASDE